MRVSGSQTTASVEKILRLGPGVDPTRLELTPAEGYLLSRIDGETSWALLRSMGGIAPDEVDRCLANWLAAGVLVAGSKDAGSARAEATQTASPPPETRAPLVEAPATPARPPADISESDLDASLEIPLDVQRRVLEFESRLDHPYHEILGVPADADRKALRKAYFKLSKELHPDRFFRRNVGGFGKRLDRIFGKIVEAYELLSDPTARAEIERSLAAAAGQEVPVATEAAPEAVAEESREPARTVRRAPRRPHVFSLHSRMVRERRARAKRLFEAGMAAFVKERWLEAAASVRLAIAFDPWNAIYKEHFGDVQRRAHEERARQTLKEAENALELRDFATALRAFEETLDYRPHDPDLLHRAARLAWATGGDLHKAKEWALAAVELDPAQAAHHRVLGQVYKAAGLEANARRELEAALAIDPKDEEARAELRGLAGRLASLRWLGGKR